MPRHATLKPASANSEPSAGPPMFDLKNSIGCPMTHDRQIRRLLRTTVLRHVQSEDYIATRVPYKDSFYSKWAPKISTSSSGGFATGTPSAPMLNSRHKVGTRIPEKR